MSGRVVLVGAGPGDPDLITVAGLKALRDADVIVTDRLVPEALLAEAGKDAEIIPVGKIPRGKFTPQERINEILVEQALAGRVVVRFKGGDPFVFGRGYEEWLACVAAGVPVSYVPGVSSSIAGAGLAGIPVTQRGITQGYTVVSLAGQAQAQSPYFTEEVLGRPGRLRPDPRDHDGGVPPAPDHRMPDRGRAGSADPIGHGGERRPAPDAGAALHRR